VPLGEGNFEWMILSGDCLNWDLLDGWDFWDVFFALTALLGVARL
jgi:hypothetical protein